MNRFYLLVGFLFQSVLSLAQGLPGYVIELNGDTTRGKIIELHDGRITLLSGSEAPPQILRAGQVRGYGIGTNAPVPSAVVRLAEGGYAEHFVLPRMVGSASLYMYAKQHGLLLRPASADTLYELDRLNWHIVFNRFLNGCASVKQTDSRMLEQFFSQESVVRVLTEYNQCIDPNWRNRQPAVPSAWQQGFTVRAGASQGHILLHKGRSNVMPNFGFEWTGLRANGLCSSLQLDYAFATEYSNTHTSRGSFGQYIDEREQAQFGLIALSYNIGKQWSRSNRVGLLVSGGSGLTVLAHSLTEIQQRPANSNGTFTTVRAYNQRGALPHVNFQAGALLPLSTNQELHLTAVYRTLLSIGFTRMIGYAGLQIGYHWSRH